MMRFLSKQALEGLQSYKYKAGGYTILDEWHNPYWNRLVDRLPLWLAPNLITLIGSLGILLAYAANIVYIPSFQEEAPAWVYLLTMASIAIYINLDCMDGKQARRTRSSSPLGQLFDHGVDALVLHMMLANISASLGVSCGWKMAAGCLGIMVPWVLAQWEEYHTGVMMYGNKYYGVLEANYSICLVHLASAIWGLQLWHALIPLPAPLVSGARSLLLSTWALADPAGAQPATAGWAESVVPSAVTVADAALLFVSMGGLAQGVSNIVRVLGPSKGSLMSEEVGYKKLGKGHAAVQMLLLLGTTILGAVSVAVAGSGDASAAGPWQDLLRGRLGLSAALESTAYCRLSYSSFGLLYALVATQLIIAHMAKQPLGVPVLALGCLGAAVSNNLLLRVLDPSLLSLAVHTIALTGYLVYTIGVIGQICEHLNIHCLRIKTKDN